LLHDIDVLAVLQFENGVVVELRPPPDGQLYLIEEPTDCLAKTPFVFPA
jgi:hypothetical protein